MKIKVLLIETGEQLKVSTLHFEKNGQLDFITLDGGRIVEPEQIEFLFEVDPPCIC